MASIPRVLAVLAGSAALLLSSLGGTALGATWVLPLAGPVEVTRPFDPPANPYGSGHRGVDLAGVPGQEVLAAGAGTVTFAAPLAGRGVMTVSHDGGLRTTYEPVRATVPAGTSVRPGEPIGTLEAGHVGCPVAACLHWGLRDGDTYLDPMSLLGGRVRLLPAADAPAPTDAARPDDDGRTAGAASPGLTGLPAGRTAGVGGLALLAATASLTLGRRGSLSPAGRAPP